MSLRKCQGPAGEPGWQAEVNGAVSACFTYDPADPMSKLRAEAQVLDAFHQLEQNHLAGIDTPVIAGA